MESRDIPRGLGSFGALEGFFCTPIHFKDFFLNYLHLILYYLFLCMLYDVNTIVVHI